MKGIAGAALAAGMVMGWDVGREPSYSVDHRGRRIAKQANPAKKAKRKAQAKARKINRNPK